MRDSRTAASSSTTRIFDRAAIAFGELLFVDLANMRWGHLLFRFPGRAFGIFGFGLWLLTKHGTGRELRPRCVDYLRSHKGQEYRDCEEHGLAGHTGIYFWLPFSFWRANCSNSSQTRG